MGWNIEDGKYQWGMGDCGKFGHTFDYPIGGFGLTTESLNKAVESMRMDNIKRLFIVEQITHNILEDTNEDFGLVYVGTSVEDIERYLQHRLTQEDIDEDTEYVFRVYQFAEKDEPKIIGKYILNNWELMKRIGGYE